MLGRGLKVALRAVQGTFWRSWVHGRGFARFGRFCVAAGHAWRVVTRLWYDRGMRCERCGGPVPVKSGRVPKFCSGACRQAAYRARKRERCLPERMTGVDRWTRCVGKRPITVEGRSASSVDESTWSAFKAVWGGPGDGFGVMLGDGLACLDLDHCFEGGELSDWARREIEAIESPLWVERSVSGDGVHVFFEGHGQSSKRGGVEWYFHSRFIRVTGDRFVL